MVIEGVEQYDNKQSGLMRDCEEVRFSAMVVVKTLWLIGTV